MREEDDVTLGAAKARIIDKLRREVGPLVLGALRDESVVEVLLNPDGTLWIERLGRATESVGTFDQSAAESVIATVASFVGRPVTETFPILECEFPLDASRFEAVLPPVVERPTFSLRKRAIKALRLGDYVASGILRPSHAAAIRDAVIQKKNIIVAGGTGSGKTTLTNAVLQEIVETSPAERLVVIEDTREIQCAARNSVALKTSETVDMTQLLRATMRLRPDRIIVGEVRGGEALALLKAWNTGHPGGVATLHAGSAKAALIRLEQLTSEATRSPMKALIAEAVDLVVVIERSPSGRQVTEVADVQGLGNNGYVINTLE